MTENLTLHLWVDNQPTDCNCTPDYLTAAERLGWRPRPGVTYDPVRMTLSGPADAAYGSFRDLAVLVAVAGHGDEDLDTDWAAPRLTAAPSDTLWVGCQTASEVLARALSRTCGTWQQFQAARGAELAKLR